MRVMILVKATVASETGEMPSPQRLTAMAAYHDTLIEAGILLAGEGPKPSRCGKRVRFSGEARTVSDGPFAESPETHAVTSEPRLNPRIRRFLTTVHTAETFPRGGPEVTIDAWSRTAFRRFHRLRHACSCSEACRGDCRSSAGSITRIPGTSSGRSWRRVSRTCPATMRGGWRL